MATTNRRQPKPDRSAQHQCHTTANANTNVNIGIDIDIDIDIDINFVCRAGSRRVTCALESRETALYPASKAPLAKQTR